MLSKRNLWLSSLAAMAMVIAVPTASAQHADLNWLNHGRPMVDAHNCYPYDGKWDNRIDRALNSGFPVSIEQDLAWYVDPATGKGRVVVSHTTHTTAADPTLNDYFFKTVRPIVEKAIKENNRSEWPLIILHFDFKETQPPILHAVWNLLGQYEPWLSTAVKTSNPYNLAPIKREPILVITEDSDAQAQVFYKDVPVGGTLRLFGSAHTHPVPAGMTQQQAWHWLATVSPSVLLSTRATDYRRWWNLSWFPVEDGGQNHAGAWTSTDDARLRALVNHAHALGYWIRFYTLDGFTPSENQGWFNSYNFGSKAAVTLRWKAAIAADVNFVATDQEEELAPYMKQVAHNLRPSATKAAKARH